MYFLRAWLAPTISSLAKYRRTPLNSSYLALGAVNLFPRYFSAIFSKIYNKIVSYFNKLCIVERHSIDSDIDNFEHAGVEGGLLVLFEREVFCGLAVVFYSQSVLVVFFVDFSNTLLDFGHVWNPVVLDMQGYRHLQQFYAFFLKPKNTSWICLLFQVSCLHIVFRRLTALTDSVALHTL